MSMVAMLQFQKQNILRKQLVTGSWHIKADRNRAQWNNERQRENDASFANNQCIFNSGRLLMRAYAGD